MGAACNGVGGVEDRQFKGKSVPERTIEKRTKEEWFEGGRSGSGRGSIYEGKGGIEGGGKGMHKPKKRDLGVPQRRKTGSQSGGTTTKEKTAKKKRD